ncbi:bacterioferritin-associated ferredoxin [Thiohalophilus sp.]|uniref:bacterioferritin-associated ferredoxin n=1 Tax=Thiohalophilus sp. TaxID=3028392 RepID=UPI002ACD7DB0|nr:bacterioferritin-associated ferredoxin [Thiohalophilus sp.]MDZ7803320.1 bacterioferritin-associated ferredoxin [Thiohalophilus sp.]
MYVCLCKGVTDTQIRDAVIDGADSLRHVRQQLGVASNCGRCAQCAREVIRQTKQEIASLDAACQVA